MADSKITALTALTAADPANDMIPIVDVSDTPPASGNTKRISINNILACSPSATLASATITGDLTVDTSTLKVDSANDNVGIGTTTPASYAFNDPVKLVIANTGTAGAGNTFTIASGSTGFGQIAFANGTSGTSRYNGYIKYSHSTNAMEFYTTAGALQATLNSTGLGVGVVPSAGKGALQLSSGINFPATQVASSDANTLDDYEEGTFTPIVRGSTVAGTGVYTSQNGFYTKVGRLVTVSVNLSWTAVTSGTGNLQFGGLPFIASNTSGAYNGISIAYVNNIATSAGTVLYGLVEFGTTLITMTQTPTGGGAYGLVPLDTSGDIAFSATYFV